MKYGKSFFLSLAASAAVVFTGCGEGGGTDTPAANAESPAAVITVERGPLLDANVTDANGTQGHELGNGQYAFDNTPQYPITATGGYIDINRNGTIDAGEVKNTLKLQAHSGDVVTIATTLAEDRNVSQLLEAAFNLAPEDIETKTPGTDKNIEALSNVVYAYAMEHNISDLSDLNATELMALKAQFHETAQNYKEDAKDAAEHEEELMQRLQVPTLDDADAQRVQEKIEEHLQKQQQKAEDSASSAMNELQEKVQEHTQQGGNLQDGTDDMVDRVKDKLQTHSQENGDSASSAMNGLQERFGDAGEKDHSESSMQSEGAASSADAMMNGHDETENGELFGNAGEKDHSESSMQSEGAASSAGGMMNGHDETENDTNGGSASSMAHAYSSAAPAGNGNDEENRDVQSSMSQNGTASSMGAHSDDAEDEDGHGSGSEDFDSETMFSRSSASAGHEGGFSAY